MSHSAILFTSPDASFDALSHNQSLMETFKVGSNISQSEKVHPRSKRYGHIVGYSMKEYGYLTLVVAFATVDSLVPTLVSVDTRDESLTLTTYSTGEKNV